MNDPRDILDLEPYRAPLKDNEWWPLPPDYLELSDDGKRKARLSVVCTQETPDDYVVAWDFFRNFYLLEGQPDGYFYDGFCPSPPFHYQGIHDLAAYGYNVYGAPRGFSKSTVFGTEVPLLGLVSRPYSKTAMCLATDSMVETRFDNMMVQLSENARIIEDFGTLKPVKGTGIWNRHALRLTNHAGCRGYGVTGRKRGERPHLFILDDPEYDPEASTSVQTLLSQFERFLFRIVIPMLKKGCKLFWIGTTITRRAFLYHAVHGNDPRFEHWNRRLLKAIEYPDGGGDPALLWPEMADQDWLEKRRKEIGSAAFSAEYLNEPVAEEDRVFQPAPRRHGYTLDGDPTEYPYTSDAKICYYKVPRSDQAGDAMEYREEPLNDILASQYIGVTVDYASTQTALSDYSAVMVWGIDNDNVLWVWDLWMGKVRDDKLVDVILSKGRHWRAKVLGIEAVSIQKLLVDKTLDALHASASKDWFPRVMPIRYKRQEAKASRIMALEWRFSQNRMKLPWYARGRFPWSELFQQLEDFTGDMNMLAHDDAVDTLAMVQYVVRGGRRGGYAPPPEPTLEDLIRKGDVWDDDGFPRVIDPTQVTPSVAAAIGDRMKRYHERNAGKQTGLKHARIRGVP